MDKKEIISCLNMVINDCNHQVDALEKYNFDDLWDVHDIRNWSSMATTLENVIELIKKG